jgi:hypothetical protein
MKLDFIITNEVMYLPLMDLIVNNQFHDVEDITFPGSYSGVRVL